MKYAGKKAGLMPSDTTDGVDKSKTTVKTTGSTNGKSNSLGQGGRAQQLKNKGLSGAIIGMIGRKKYGAKAMGKWSAAGR